MSFSDARGVYNGRGLELAWRIGSSLGAREGSGKVRQEVSALDYPNRQEKSRGRGCCFSSFSINLNLR